MPKVFRGLLGGESARQALKAISYCRRTAEPDQHSENTWVQRSKARRWQRWYGKNGSLK